MSGILLVLLPVACSDSGLSLTEYASQIDQMVEAKSLQIDALEADLSSQPPGVDRTKAYWEGRAAAGVMLLEELETIDPPREVAELHAATLDIMSRYVAAEGEYAVRAGSVQTMAELEASAEAEAVMAVEGEIIAMCRAAQATFDDTADGAAFAVPPWIPPELREVIRVAFRCAGDASPREP